MSHEWRLPVKHRLLTTSMGYSFDVPEYIVRIDQPDFKGWQLRYGEWTGYPDRPGSQPGMKAALDEATIEMRSRMEALGK